MRNIVYFAAVLSLGTFSSFAWAGNCVFLRGDANGDGNVTIADSTKITNYLGGGSAPANLDAADADDQNGVNSNDSVYILCFLFGGGGCPSPAPAPPSPYPTQGCDCTTDTLEPCCSRQTGAADPEKLTISSVTVTPVAGSTWGSTATAVVGTDRVRITTQNGPNCDRGNTSAFFDVVWSLTDPHGIDDSAIDDGCVGIASRFRVRADYSVDQDDCITSCPEYRYNQLGVAASPNLEDYYVTFQQPGGSSTVTIAETAGTFADIYHQYNLIEYCDLNNVYLDGYDEVTGTLTDTGSTSLDCWKLTKYTVKDIEYYYERFGNPRLTEGEFITWDDTNGYSLKLMELEYNWCNP